MLVLYPFIAFLVMSFALKHIQLPSHTKRWLSRLSVWAVAAAMASAKFALGLSAPFSMIAFVVVGAILTLFTSLGAMARHD
ncbi:MULTISPECIES: hypothetical protein [Pseudoalteromonas]|uniref:Uncharacterized protein n=1 Tax=Pseudoalteromonas obscura TaxID=3048491 RepID=A0ABT7ET91_9GAMM|nr:MULTISPECIES: hypothetical protein [Pseudoalteromonas]MBQ4839706.1 hypothetical protein [Pseudoalteromonas luteoviolacea]MCG7551259.1 hypothetical protein [Pseudoalteromonas sp. Of7M-16]MDK2598214.1 hypothetical protein [Pseudoalteromonas sp. P94(2023)]